MIYVKLPNGREYIRVKTFLGFMQMPLDRPATMITDIVDVIMDRLEIIVKKMHNS